MKLRLEILPQEQLEVYSHFKTITDLGFTLFGGTALALQLGHRQSVDFDFFTDKDISKLHTQLLNLENISVKKVNQQEPNTLAYVTNNGVKISFFGTLDFVKLANTIQIDDGIVKIADLEALLITKLKATCDRAEYKDYKDIIEILKTGKITLEQGLLGVKRYFGDNFPLVSIIKGLTYFEDGDLYELSKKDKLFLCDKAIKVNVRF